MVMPIKADQRIASALAHVDAVEQVYIRRVGDVFRVFTIVSDDPDDVCDAIYDRERELIREFASSRFDFNIIARRGQSVLDLIGPMTPTWQRHDWCQTGNLI